WFSHRMVLDLTFFISSTSLEKWYNSGRAQLPCASGIHAPGTVAVSHPHACDRPMVMANVHKYVLSEFWQTVLTFLVWSPARTIRSDCGICAM
ncbi:hypothetical protein, partial [Microcoleus sp. F4-D5]|uniref:hypothetical protein n=1 Tax=Microcoleus sp. F4-D5 TaxID=2818760 RepID=UPI002FD6DDA2